MLLNIPSSYLGCYSTIFEKRVNSEWKNLDNFEDVIRFTEHKASPARKRKNGSGHPLSPQKNHTSWSTSTPIMYEEPIR